MTIFASKHWTRDPLPWIDLMSPTSTRYADEPHPRIPWTNVVYRPRSEYGNRLPVNPILERTRTWNVTPGEMIWAIEHGAERPNDPRSARLRAAADIGGTRLKPFDGEWVPTKRIAGSGIRLGEALDHAHEVLSRLPSPTGDAQ